MSKKFILYYLPFILMLFLIVVAYKPINVNVNSNSMEFSIGPILINDSIMVPASEIASIFNADSIINKNKQVLSINNNTHYIKFMLGEKKCIINGVIYYLNAETLIIENTIMVPLELIAKCFEAEMIKEITFNKIDITISYINKVSNLQAK